MGCFSREGGSGGRSGPNRGRGSSSARGQSGGRGQYNGGRGQYSGGRGQYGVGNNSGRGRGNRAYEICEEVQNPDEENYNCAQIDEDNNYDFYVYNLNSGTESKARMDFFVEHSPLNMLIDSGANCNLITDVDLQKVISETGHINITKWTKKKTVTDYGGQNLSLLGSCELNIVVPITGKQCKGRFLVVDNKCNKPSVLGEFISKDLDVLKVGIDAIGDCQSDHNPDYNSVTPNLKTNQNGNNIGTSYRNVSQPNVMPKQMVSNIHDSVSTNNVTDIGQMMLKRYPKVFTGLGLSLIHI